MRNILSDWYEDELCSMDSDEGAQKLVGLFESAEIRLKPLAVKLKSYIDKKNDKDEETIKTKVYEKFGANVIEMISSAVKNGSITKDKMEGIARCLGPYVEKEHKKRQKNAHIT